MTPHSRNSFVKSDGWFNGKEREFVLFIKNYRYIEIFWPFIFSTAKKKIWQVAKKYARPHHH